MTKKFKDQLIEIIKKANFNYWHNDLFDFFNKINNYQLRLRAHNFTLNYIRENNN